MLAVSHNWLDDIESVFAIKFCWNSAKKVKSLKTSL